MSVISFEFLTDLRRFLPGVRQVSSALDDIEADLRGAAAAGDRLERDMDSAFRTIRTDASRTGSSMKLDIGDGVRRAGDTAKEGAREVGGELAENLAEGFQSGDFAGVAAETAASLTNGLAGVAGAAGAAAGVGFGVVSLVVQQMRQRADQIRAVGVSFGESLANAMQDGLSRAEIRSEAVEALKQSLEDAGITMGEFAEMAEKSGLSMDQIVGALIKGGPAYDQMIARLGKIIASGTRTVSSGKAVATGQSEQAKAAARLKDVLGRVNDGVQQGIENAIALADAMDGGRKSADDYRRDLDRVRGSYDRLGKAAQRAADDVVAAGKRIGAARGPATGSSDYPWWYYTATPSRGTPRGHMRDGRR